MMVRAYRILQLEAGIDALDLTEIDLPATLVVDRSIVSLEESGEIPLNDPGERRRPVRFRVPTASGEAPRIVHGFLVAEPGEALERLVEGIRLAAPGAGFPVGSGLGPRVRPFGDYPRKLRRRRHTLRFDGEARRVTSVADPRLQPGDLDEDDFDRVALPGHLLRKAADHDALALVADTTVAHGAHAVPRRAFVVVAGGHGTPHCLWYDGVRGGRGTFPASVPRSLLRRLETLGRPLADAVPDPLPLPLDPVFLLRVPTDDEAEALESPEAAPALPAQPLCAAPLYMVDTRAPVALPPGLPIVDDPAAALAILARTHDGIYVPEDAAIPGAPPAGHAGWLIACRAAS